MKLKSRICSGLIVAVLGIVVAYIYLYIRWRPTWQPVEPQSSYQVHAYVDDTLRVIMIGDSWAALHYEWGHDTKLSKLLCEQTNRPVQMIAKGKGGAKSGDIYLMMFRESNLNTRLCTQPLIELAPDYAVITAGINDAAANVGTNYFCENYLLIIRHLLSCGICPVVVEMPDVDIEGLYGSKPLKDYVVDRLRSWMTHVSFYDVRPYREALYDRLLKENLMDSVIYVSLNQWQPSYIEDGVHLNAVGYHRLDSCLAASVAERLKQM